jgi:hypothetical protein
MLVLFSDIVLLAQVDEVDDWLGCKEEKRVDDFDLYTFSLALGTTMNVKECVEMCIWIRTGFVSHMLSAFS